jgi:hypothetical protein
MPKTPMALPSQSKPKLRAQRQSAATLCFPFSLSVCLLLFFAFGRIEAAQFKASQRITSQQIALTHQAR